MKYKTIISTMLIIFFIVLQGPNTLSLSIFNDQKPSVVPSVSFNANFQTAYNISNDGLKDFSLFKTEFAVDTAYQVTAEYALSWNHTIAGIGGAGGMRSFTVNPGTYNFSIFLGLAYLKYVNAPNTTVNGTYDLNITLAEVNAPYTTYGTFQMPQVLFVYNTSEISYRIPYVTSIDLLNYPESLPLVRTNAYYQWDYNSTNINGATTMVGEIGRSLVNGYSNGTIGMALNESLYGFNIGKIYNNNVSLTSDLVPIGYPFSDLKLPGGLTLVEFEGYFLPMNGYTNSYALNSGILSVNSTMGNNYNWSWEYNQTSGVLLNYSYTSSSSYESLHLTYPSSEFAGTSTQTTTSSTTTSTTSTSSTTTTSSSTSTSSTSSTSTSSQSSSTSTSSTSNSTSNESSKSTPLEGIYSIASMLLLSSIYVIKRRKQK